MKKITKPNGEIIICSEYESELDDESLYLSSEEETPFEQELEILNTSDDIAYFGSSEEVKVIISFGKHKNNKDFITTDEIHGIIKSYSKKSFTHKIEFFVDISKICEITEKINKFSISSELIDFKISVTYMTATTDLYETGNIIYYKISKIKNSNVFYKIIIGQR